MKHNRQNHTSTTTKTNNHTPVKSHTDANKGIRRDLVNRVAKSVIKEHRPALDWLADK
jgi:hypothetical protein